jgi:1-acyl-sn-glycerol-3-phosphate acyltransferase
VTTLGPAARAARIAWLRYWRTYQRYHRYEVRGFEHLATGPAALIVGYHGRSIARDLCMLSVHVHDRLGYMPHAIFHRAFGTVPFLRPVMEGVDGVPGDAPALAAAVARGEHVLVTPGGTREGCRSFRDRYRVDWGRRTGYLRLALRLGLDVVPVAAAGTDDTYVGLNDGHAWGRRARLPLDLPLWLGLGPLGPWPLSPPFPVRIRQLVGPRIALPAVDPADRAALGALHERVTGAVQALLEEARRVD